MITHFFFFYICIKFWFTWVTLKSLCVRVWVKTESATGHSKMLSDIIIEHNEEMLGS